MCGPLISARQRDRVQGIWIWPWPKAVRSPAAVVDQRTRRADFSSSRP
ncbi:aldehyde dehydrogenase domain protein [Mycobacterium xenopi 4042]|uniref:Aldehyde dehydrogenase domain protein n=1 Tax=Mycobacterium xenopi 4042 TaxID=1299334 RepID=X8AHV6_MYCXE|nr:aldehyde dehydrogenase domain protein [Mycobacterium xenopi 4042]